MEWILSHKWVIILLAAAVLLAVLLPVRSARKKKRKNEELAQQRRRNEALTDALRNPAVEKGIHRDAPMEVDWDENAIKGRKKRKKGGQMAELTDISEYSRRRYVYPLEEGPVRVGSSRDNSMELLREGVARFHFEILLNDGRPCVRSLEDAPTVLKRGREQAVVSSDGLFLKNGDVIKAGSAEIQFRMFKG